MASHFLIMPKTNRDLLTAMASSDRYEAMAVGRYLLVYSWLKKAQSVLVNGVGNFRQVSQRKGSHKLTNGDSINTECIRTGI